MDIKNKYNNGKIYKLLHNDKIIYIGSTIQSLSERLRCHKKTSKVKPDIKLYKYIANVGWDNIMIDLVEECNCNLKKELETRERYFIDNLQPELNTNIPCRTNKEWYNDNKEKMDLYYKEYRKSNKDKLTEQKNKWRLNNKEKSKEKYICECGRELRKSDKNRHEKTIKHITYINSLKTDCVQFVSIPTTE